MTAFDRLMADETLAYYEMRQERLRAHSKHVANGGSMEEKPPLHAAWLPVLGEEFGEVARVLCEIELGNVDGDVALLRLREELVQVGAMTAAWIDSIDADREADGG